MQKHNLNVLIEYDDQRFNPKVLMSEPGFRMVFLSMRARQLIPEHTSKGMATVQVIMGHVTLFAGSFPTNCMPERLSASRAGCHIESKQSRIQLCSFSPQAVWVPPWRTRKNWICIRFQNLSFLHLCLNDSMR